MIFNFFSTSLLSASQFPQLYGGDSISFIRVRYFVYNWEWCLVHRCYLLLYLLLFLFQYICKAKWNACLPLHLLIYPRAFQLFIQGKAWELYIGSHSPVHFPLYFIFLIPAIQLVNMSGHFITSPEDINPQNNGERHSAKGASGQAVFTDVLNDIMFNFQFQWISYVLLHT